MQVIIKSNGNSEFLGPGIYVECDQPKDMQMKTGFYIDVGPGSEKMMDEDEWKNLYSILISHFHADHAVLTEFFYHLSTRRNRNIIPLYGPVGTGKRVFHGLNATIYEGVEKFGIRAHDVHEDKLVWSEFKEEDREFESKNQGEIPCVNDNGLITIMDNEIFKVRAMYVEHQVPCLSYSITEKTRLSINFQNEKLDELRLKRGRWMKKARETISDSDSSDLSRDELLNRVKGEKAIDRYTIGDLVEKGTLVINKSEAKKLSYVVDALYSNDLLNLVRGSNVLLCSARARHYGLGKRVHMNIEEAVNLAKKGEVENLVLIHMGWDAGLLTDHLWERSQGKRVTFGNFREESLVLQIDKAKKDFANLYIGSSREYEKEEAEEEQKEEGTEEETPKADKPEKEESILVHAFSI